MESPEMETSILGKLHRGAGRGDEHGAAVRAERFVVDGHGDDAVGAEGDLLDKTGNPAHTSEILLVDSLAAVAGGLGSVSSNTSYIESAAGVGDVLAIGEHRFPITAIGALAQRNLDSLGHVTLVFDGADEPRLEGALHVRCGGELPRPQAGSTILIESA